MKQVIVVTGASSGFGALAARALAQAGHPHIDDSLALAEAALRDGMMLAPGTVFRPHLERSPWMRFNVAVCEDTRVQRRLQRLASSVAV
jgi:NAD(P)-dependent dehydrogenase (short-subunit alcohol dehydrogenase family)